MAKQEAFEHLKKLLTKEEFKNLEKEIEERYTIMVNNNFIMRLAKLEDRVADLERRD